MLKSIYIQKMKKVNLAIMAVFYLLAGVNHFRNPEAYYQIIPPYFSNPHFINLAAGAVEIIFAGLLLIPATKKFACNAIIAMLHLSIFMQKVLHGRIHRQCLKPVVSNTWPAAL